MEVIIDRFEGTFAIVELPDGEMANLPAVLVPGAREGDIVQITVDGKATMARAEKIKKLANKLWAD